MNRRGKSVFVGLLTAMITLVVGFAVVPDVKASTVEELRRRREQLARDIERNRKAAEEKKRQAQELANQIQKIDQERVVIQGKIEATKAHIEDRQEVINVLTIKIAEKLKELERTQEQQREALRTIYETGDDNVTLLVLGPSITDEFDRLAYLQDLEARIEETIDTITRLKQELQDEKKNQEEEKANLETLKLKQESYKKGLEENRKRKDGLLGQTKKTQAELETLVEDARKAYADVTSELHRLTQAAKTRGRSSGEKKVKDLVWRWPLDGIITTEWGEPTRIQNFHTGIDVDLEIGDDVKAAASGRVSFAGGDRSYGYGLYVKVDHGSGVESLYGHCDRLLVGLDDQVEGGKSVVCLGGNTGFAYAFHPSGNGSHLHFETREDGVPVNPRIYLP